MSSLDHQNSRYEIEVITSKGCHHHCEYKSVSSQNKFVDGCDFILKNVEVNHLQSIAVQNTYHIIRV